MPRHFDLILAGATVVNQDGAAQRDVGVANGKIAEIGDLYAAAAGERTSRPARAARSSAASPRCSRCPTPTR